MSPICSHYPLSHYPFQGSGTRPGPSPSSRLCAGASLSSQGLTPSQAVPPGIYPSHPVWALKTCARPPHFRDIVSVCLSSDTVLCASVPLFSEYGLSLTLLRLIPWSRPLQFPYSAHMCPARPHKPLLA